MLRHDYFSGSSVHNENALSQGSLVKGTEPHSKVTSETKVFSSWPSFQRQEKYERCSDSRFRKDNLLKGRWGRANMEIFFKKFSFCVPYFMLTTTSLVPILTTELSPFTCWPPPPAFQEIILSKPGITTSFILLLPLERGPGKEDFYFQCFTLL